MLNNLPPELYFFLRYNWLKYKKKIEKEMAYLDKILSKKRRFVDIGSNFGIYSYYFRNKFMNIEAFEPINEITYHLKGLSKYNINVHNLGLSNLEGEAQISIPFKNGKLHTSDSSLNKIDNNSYEQRRIKTKTLDSFHFTNVDLIKIDVEGHEENVINGSQATILNSKPILLVEIERRHLRNKKIDDIFNLICSLSYDGYFLLNGKMISISKFEVNKYQNQKMIATNDYNYTNNFIFIEK